VGATIQRDLDKLEKYTKRSLKKFSKGKCKVLLMSRDNPRQQYTVGVDWDWKAILRGPQVPLDNNLTMSQQCAHVAKVANSLLHCIRKTIASRKREVLFPFYLVLV